MTFSNDPLNLELRKIHYWLKSNRLCLNASKTKYMIFNKTKHKIQTNLKIDDIVLEEVNEFNFLGLNVSNSADWKSHTKKIQTKISRNIGLLKRINKLLPRNVLIDLYYTLIHCHINYMLLVWGYDYEPILALQKKALRVIYSKHPRCHSDPLFKSSKIMKIPDLHTLAQLKFCHKYIGGQLPQYLASIPFNTNDDFHHYDTRHSELLRLPQPRTERGRKCLRNSVPNLLNSLPSDIRYCLNQPIGSMISYFKRAVLSGYHSNCSIPDCYSCRL